MADIMKITSAGLAAAATARTNGPLVDIVKFAVGSAYGYTPSQADTALHGTQLYPSGINPNPPTNYYVTTDSSGNKVANYSLILDDSIGDFQFGEVGVYLPDGTLFGLQAFSYLQTKNQSTPSVAGNTIEMLLKMTMTDGEPVIEFTTITAQTATRAELATEDLLLTPAAADANTYLITTKDEYGRAPVFDKADSANWYSPQYDMKVGVFTAGSTNSHYSVTAAGELAKTDYNVLPGRYIVRFITGAFAGRVRLVTPTPLFSISTVYVANQIIRPIVANGHIYRVTTAGTSAGASPTWNTGAASTTASGSVVFTEEGIDNDHTFSWAGSLGAAVATGVQFEVYRASSWTDLPRYMLEVSMNSRAFGYFIAHH